MGGGNHILKLLASEDVNGGEVTFGVTVLSSFGDGDVNDLAGLSLNHNVSRIFAMKIVVRLDEFTKNVTCIKYHSSRRSSRGITAR